MEGTANCLFNISLISWYSMINTNIKMTKKRSLSWSNNYVVGSNKGWDPVYSVKASDSMKVLILTQSFLYCKELRQVLRVGGSKVLLSMMGIFFGEIVSRFLYCKELRQVLRVGGSKVESNILSQYIHFVF